MDSSELRKELRQLCDQAYNKELNEALRELQQHFQTWNEGQLSTTDLNARIDEYYQGIYHELRSYYSRRDIRHTVANAVANGILSEEELSPECREDLSKLIRFCHDSK